MGYMNFKILWGIEEKVNNIKYNNCERNWKNEIVTDGNWKFQNYDW